jgi:mRNA interferase RelE/StbE
VDRTQARLVREWVDRLATNPYGTLLDLKGLVGRAGFRLRIGDWRVIYGLDDGIRTLAVSDVRHRREAYH